MGFDLYGLNPVVSLLVGTTNPGEYFRNNCWWWRPLWDYVYDNCQDIITENDYQQGGFNQGHEITAKKAKAIAERLEQLVKDGKTKDYETWRKKELEKLEQVPCRICDGTGKRDDEIIKGKCNGCDGTGKVDPWDKSYPFSEENVKGFAKFCRESGGFKIC